MPQISEFGKESHFNSTSEKYYGYDLFEWERRFTLIFLIVIMFFFTRAAPFPANLYWDLIFARDFDLNIGWALLPEQISYLILQTPFSEWGLKVLYHVFYFLLCIILAIWAFKCKEVLPPVILVLLFTLSLQSVLTLRVILQMIFIVCLISLFDGDYLKNSYGLAIIPITAAASALGINSWLLILLITIYTFVNADFSLSLIFCGVIGILFFPEGASSSIMHTPLSAIFIDRTQLELITSLSLLFLVINVVNLYKIDETTLPLYIYYVFLGIFGSIDYSYLPYFGLVGLLISILNLSDLMPLTHPVRICGLLLLALILHVSLFFHPIGFSLNPRVKNDLGASLLELVDKNNASKRVKVFNVAELAWKGLINLKYDELATLISNKDKFVNLINKDGTIIWQIEN